MKKLELLVDKVLKQNVMMYDDKAKGFSDRLLAIMFFYGRHKKFRPRIFIASAPVIIEQYPYIVYPKLVDMFKEKGGSLPPGKTNIIIAVGPK